jgi:hypothetical protein
MMTTMRLALVLLATGWIGCVAQDARAEGDVFLSELVVYALPTPGLEGDAPGGGPTLLEAWDPHGGLSPSTVDVVVVVNGGLDDPVRVVLELVPVVGLTNWANTEGITDLALLDASKTSLPASVRLEQEQAVQGRTEVRFPGIDLSSIIDGYVALDLWPAELIVRATALPRAGETSLRNNVLERRLPLTPMD